MATLTLMQRIGAIDTPWANHNDSSKIMDDLKYPEDIEAIRQQEYPALQGTTYLDHAGTTLYAKSMIASYTAELTSNLFGNPHSTSASSQLSSTRIADIRFQVLKFFGADPAYFDIVFVANATAAIKLVADSFRDYETGFWYGYHVDSHTSLIGVRELARLGNTCFGNDQAVDAWISKIRNQENGSCMPMLFAYPGQSNMTGRRLPLDWCGRVRAASTRSGQQVYSLLDAAALASTSPLNFSCPDASPDFTTLSFYKIFGFPDLGALIVRKASGHMLHTRRYFGGGSVDAVSVGNDEPWHMKRETLHSALEDGTLPFHSIIALDHAIKAQYRIYGSMRNVADHVAMLRTTLFERMRIMRHNNGTPVCKLYSMETTNFSSHGPLIAFNLLDSSERYISNTEFEKLAIVKGIQLRTGTFCNPGGIAYHLNLSAESLKKHYAAGHRCGGENDIVDGKPLGAIRISLGAMSSLEDINSFLSFLKEYYVSQEVRQLPHGLPATSSKSRFRIDSMHVFPIKSCSSFSIPDTVNWNISSKGLAWDREWCLVHQGSNAALSQKQFPQMALLQPVIDLKRRIMTVSFVGDLNRRPIEIALDEIPPTLSAVTDCGKFKQQNSMVCGESVPVHVYTEAHINDFFSQALGVPCALARYFSSNSEARLSRLRVPKAKSNGTAWGSQALPSIKLSNESPILLVNRSSVNRLNEEIKHHRSQSEHISPESFRANIVISEETNEKYGESPYVEDCWQHLMFGDQLNGMRLKVMGPCRRCQMVCVNQMNAKRRQEPFSTLSKTRRWGGGVWFGIHLCLDEDFLTGQKALRIGDAITPF